MKITGAPKKKTSRISKYLLLSGALTMAFILGAIPAYPAQIQTGVVATVAPDWSSAAHSVISVDPVGGPRSVRNNLLPTSTSDIAVNAYGRYFYRIEKFQADNVTKFDIDAPATPIWQYSTQSGEVASSNPYGLTFLSSQKAYLMRYGSTKAWIVNPSTTTEAGFKIGELDLSSYSDADGAPNMAAGVIANGKLFIMLQRLEYWCPSTTAYVAVFDVGTNTEIDTGLGEGGRKGIPLSIKNPVGIHYLPDNNTIYVVGVGSFPGGFCPPEYEYTGGIISLNPVSYATAMIVDDGDAEHHPYGAISGMMVVSSAKGYFVGYAGWGNNSLYTFNPSTGAVAGPLDDFNGISISGMQSGLALDENDMLWVCNQTASTVDIVNTLDDTIDERLATNLSPQMTAFCTKGTPAPTSGFTGQSNAGVAPLTVLFTDQSTGTITSWTWDFGDSDSSVEKNPVHTYNNPASYSVSLTVEGPGGSDIETKQHFITVVSEYIYVKPDGICDDLTPCYATIQGAINEAEAIAIIKIAQGMYAEDIVMDKAKRIILQSGWDAGFEDPLGDTGIHSLTIGDGTLKLGKGRIVIGE